MNKEFIANGGIVDRNFLKAWRSLQRYKSIYTVLEHHKKGLKCKYDIITRAYCVIYDNKTMELLHADFWESVFYMGRTAHKLGDKECVNRITKLIYSL